MIRASALFRKGLIAPLVVAASLLGCGGSSAPPDDASSIKAESPPESPAMKEFRLGKEAAEQEKFAEAKTHLAKAHELEPSNALILFYMGLVEEGLGNTAEAETSYKSALSADPKSAGAAQNLAALYLRDPPRPDEAIDLLSKTLKVYPEDVGLIQNLAYAYSLKSDVANASRYYDLLLTKKGGDTAQARLAYADFLLKADQGDKAVEQLKKALASAEKDVPVLVSVGLLLGAAKAYGDCVAAFDRAITAKSDDAELYYRRGNCRRGLKDEAGARADYESAIKVNPNVAVVHYFLGLSWAADKDIAKARASLTKAAELGKDTDVGKSARDKLNALPKK